jgi:hypothetical protein
VRYVPYVCDGNRPLIHSYQRVQSAAVSVLGTAGDVAHELLRNGVDLLGFVPIPGLDAAARTLLQIWDTLQQVDVNLLPTFRNFCSLNGVSVDEPLGVSSPHTTVCGHPPVHS